MLADDVEYSVKETAEDLAELGTPSLVAIGAGVAGLGVAVVNYKTTLMFLGVFGLGLKRFFTYH